MLHLIIKPMIINFCFLFILTGFIFVRSSFADSGCADNDFACEIAYQKELSAQRPQMDQQAETDSTESTQQTSYQAPVAAPAPAPSPVEQAELGAAQQIGYSIGQNIAQALFGSPQTAQQQAAQQEQQREIAAQQAYAAQQAAIAEQQRQEEIARQQQATHDRLVSEMQSDDGTSYGIKGLPGIYLNNPSGSSSQQGLQLMKDDDSATPDNSEASASPSNSNENTAAASSNVTETENGVPLMKDDDNAPSAPNAASPAPEPPAQSSIPLMKDDDTAASDDQSGQKAVDLSGVPVSKSGLQNEQAENGGPDFDGKNGGNAPVSAAVDLRGTGTAVVDPAVVNGTSPKLETINPSEADKALMRNQWDMNINPRYLSDPAVQQGIRDLWSAARSGDSGADDKLKAVVTDQFKATGMAPLQIKDFFDKLDDIFSGEGKVPNGWNNNDIANGIDAAVIKHNDLNATASYYLDSKDVRSSSINPLIALNVNVPYKGTAKQTEDDCVLYAIADGSGADLQKVRDTFKDTVSNLGMEDAADRSNPGNMLATPNEGGRGGTGPVEELLVAEKFGDVVPVPKDSFARALASTGQPIITTVKMNPSMGNGGEHKVVVTGVYQCGDGKFYYSVMDSNLYDANKNPQSTEYVEKSFFEDHLASGGFVVMPNGK